MKTRYYLYSLLIIFLLPLSCSNVTFDNPNDPGSDAYIPGYLTVDSDAGLLEEDVEGVNVVYCDFGNVAKYSSEALSFTIMNSGRDDLIVESVSISGDDADAFELDSFGLIEYISQNQLTDFKVSFNPTDHQVENDGNISASLTIETNDPENPVSVIELRGRCIVPKLRVEYKGKEVKKNGKLNYYCSLDDTDELVFVIKNTGEAELEIINDIQLGTSVATGSDEISYSVSSYPINYVRAGSATFFKINVMPYKGLRPYSASVSFRTNDDDNTVFTFYINHAVGKDYTSSDYTYDNGFGSSASSDGDYTIVGACQKNTNEGFAYIFKKNSDGTLAVPVEIVADDVAAGDKFGYSVAISGDYAVVGAPYDDDGGDDSGSAYIFKRDGANWTQIKKFSGNWDSKFGYSVSISGDYAIVGAPFDQNMDGAIGRAYVFKNVEGTWTEQKMLSMTSPAVEDEFGSSVSISGDYAIVGVPGDDDKGSNSGSAVIFERDGEDWTETQKITMEDGASSDQFGDSVSISGDYAVVGAWCDDNYSGSACIFKRDNGTWTQIQKLTIDDGAPMICFGRSVTINGSYAIVGTPNDNILGSNSGSAYMYRKGADDSWTEECRILPTGAVSDLTDRRFGKSVALSSGFAVILSSSTVTGFIHIPVLDRMNRFFADEGEQNVEFGSSVSISGDYAIVGAHDDNVAGMCSGSASIFKNESGNWIKMQKLIAGDPKEFVYFGWSVAISGDYALVGCPLDFGDGHATGSAYVFKREGETWTQKQKLSTGGLETNDHFGGSVSISGDYVLISATGDDDKGTDSGAVYIFKREGETWALKQKLAPDAFGANDMFGCSVSTNGIYTVVGAPYDDDTGTYSGAVYIFKRENETWTQKQKLTPDDWEANDLFGYSVSTNGIYTVVGAPYDDDKGTDSGSVYIFKRENETWTQAKKVAAYDGVTGDRFGSSVSISGSRMVAGADLNDYMGTDAGSAYVFELDQNGLWDTIFRLFPLDGNVYTEFGGAVSADGYNVIVGTGDDSDTPGVAFIYNVE